MRREQVAAEGAHLNTGAAIASRATRIEPRAAPAIELAVTHRTREGASMHCAENARFLKEPACADSVKLRLSLCLWQALQPSFARVPRGS